MLLTPLCYKPMLQTPLCNASKLCLSRRQRADAYAADASVPHANAADAVVLKPELQTPKCHAAKPTPMCRKPMLLLYVCHKQKLLLPVRNKPKLCKRRSATLKSRTNVLMQKLLKPVC